MERAAHRAKEGGVAYRGEGGGGRGRSGAGIALYLHVLTKKS